MLERIEEIGRSCRIVYYERNAVLVGDLSDSIKVKNCSERIGDRLDIDRLSLRLDLRCDVIGRCINVSKFDTVLYRDIIK